MYNYEMYRNNSWSISTLLAKLQSLQESQYTELHHLEHLLDQTKLLYGGLKLQCHFIAFRSNISMFKGIRSLSNTHIETYTLKLNIKLLLMLYSIFYLDIDYHNYIEASRGAGTQSVTRKPTGCGFDPHSRRWNIYLNLYWHFFALVSRRSAALSSATQHAIPPDSVKSGAWIVLILGILCLSCFVRDTAWSWYWYLMIYNYIIFNLFI